MTTYVPGRLARTRDAVSYCLTTLAIGFACLLSFPLLLLAGLTMLLGIGLVLAPPALRLFGALADFERRRAGRRLGLDTPGHQPGRRRLRELLADPATRRDLTWLPVQMLAGTVLGVLGLMFTLLPLAALAATGFWWVFPDDEPIRVLGSVPIESWAGAATLGLVQLVASVLLAFLLLPLIADASAQLSHWRLAMSEKEALAARVETLRESRAGAVDAHGAELRRIERDLHDGTQARLVSIAMRLGLAERQLDADPQAVATLLAEARAGAESAMAELRDVLRTMYPPILADRGLAGALSAVVAGCAVPTELVAGELGELAAPVEAAAYYVVTESLTNVAKHSGATSARVMVARAGDRLLVEVADNGRGGVDEGAGSGVAGMRRRLAALDGTLDLRSTVDGTTVRMECPCGS